MKKLHLFFICFLLTITYSCEKETNSIEKSALITINHPTTSTVINLGDTLKINATISANFELHGYTLLIYPFNNKNQKIYEKNNHTHGEIINIQEEWINTNISDKELIFEVIANLSHGGDDIQNKFVQFIVN